MARKGHQFCSVPPTSRLDRAGLCRGGRGADGRIENPASRGFCKALLQPSCFCSFVAPAFRLWACKHSCKHLQIEMQHISVLFCNLDLRYLRMYQWSRPIERVRKIGSSRRYSTRSKSGPLEHHDVFARHLFSYFSLRRLWR